MSGLEAALACFEPLFRLGYVYAPYLPEEMHWFCKPGFKHRTHHLHLVSAGCRRFREELAFRDALRSDPQTAAEYATLKRRLAAGHRDDREAYTTAKSAFVRAVLDRTEGSPGPIGH